MLVGNNEIRLCPAEMFRAVQHYFDTVLFRVSPGEVYKVAQEKEHNWSEGFVVSIREPQNAVESCPRPPTPQGQNGTAGKPQVGECTTSAIA